MAIKYRFKYLLLKVDLQFSLFIKRIITIFINHYIYVPFYSLDDIAISEYLKINQRVNEL